MSTRDDTRLETRAALLSAALAEFVEKGIDAPSLDAICARAGYTRGAFYVHFKDREDLLAAVMEQVITAWLDTMVASADPAHDLRRTVERFAEAFAAILAAPADAGPLALSARRFHVVLESCGRSDVVRQRFVSMVGVGSQRLIAATKAGQEAGTVRADLDPQAAATLLVTLALGLLCVIQTGIPLDPDAARKLVIQLMAPEIA